VCGRYAASRNADDLVEEFEVEWVDVKERLEPDWNVAPTKDVYAIVQRKPRGEDVPETADPIRQLRVVRWGLVPSWAKDPSIGSRLINARMETVAEKPAFRRAFSTRRCLLPADGYYEWYAPDGSDFEPPRSGGKTRKQPFFITPRDDGVLAMAGLYEFWRDPKAGEDEPNAWLVTCSVLTTEAEDSLGRIHDRMPLLVERERWPEWLDPRLSDPDRLTGLLVPAAPGRLEAYPVSTLVNDVKNNGPELVDPVPMDEPMEEEANAATLF
jgi:putative SOS response-associated peptidase YedK